MNKKQIGTMLVAGALLVSQASISNMYAAAIDPSNYATVPRNGANEYWTGDISSVGNFTMTNNAYAQVPTATGNTTLTGAGLSAGATQYVNETLSSSVTLKRSNLSYFNSTERETVLLDETITLVPYGGAIGDVTLDRATGNIRVFLDRTGNPDIAQGFTIQKSYTLSGTSTPYAVRTNYTVSDLDGDQQLRIAGNALNADSKYMISSTDTDILWDNGTWGWLGFNTNTAASDAFGKIGFMVLSDDYTVDFATKYREEADGKILLDLDAGTTSSIPNIPSKVAPFSGYTVDGISSSDKFDTNDENTVFTNTFDGNLTIGATFKDDMATSQLGADTITRTAKIERVNSDGTFTTIKDTATLTSVKSNESVSERTYLLGQEDVNLLLPGNTYRITYSATDNIGSSPVIATQSSTVTIVGNEVPEIAPFSNYEYVDNAPTSTLFEQDDALDYFRVMEHGDIVLGASFQDVLGKNQTIADEIHTSYEIIDVTDALNPITVVKETIGPIFDSTVAIEDRTLYIPQEITNDLEEDRIYKVVYRATDNVTTTPGVEPVVATQTSLVSIVGNKVPDVAGMVVVENEDGTTTTYNQSLDINSDVGTITDPIIIRDNVERIFVSGFFQDIQVENQETFDPITSSMIIYNDTGDVVYEVKDVPFDSEKPLSENEIEIDQAILDELTSGRYRIELTATDPYGVSHVANMYIGVAGNIIPDLWPTYEQDDVVTEVTTWNENDLQYTVLESDLGELSVGVNTQDIFAADQSDADNISVSYTISKDGVVLHEGPLYDVMADDVEDNRKGIIDPAIIESLEVGTYDITYFATDNIPNADTRVVHTQLIVEANTKVIYDANYENGSIQEDGMYGRFDDITILENPFVREHFTFVSWNTMPDGTGTTYTQEEVLALEGEGITLYAQWEDVKYTITYHPNHSALTGVQDEEMYLFNQEIGLLSPEDIIEMSECTFLGWSLYEDGSGTLLSPEDMLTIDGNMNVFAVWECIEEEAPILPDVPVVPQTGDTTSTLGITSMLGLSLAGVVTMFWRKKKK